MKDKNGGEITDGSYLRIRFKMYENELYDGIYKVSLDGFSGLKCSLVELFTPEVTFHVALRWERKDFTFAYKRYNEIPDYFDYLAIDEQIYKTTYRDREFKILRHYSDDIELINYTENG